MHTQSFARLIISHFFDYQKNIYAKIHKAEQETSKEVSCSAYVKKASALSLNTYFREFFQFLSQIQQRAV